MKKAILFPCLLIAFALASCSFAQDAKWIPMLRKTKPEQLLPDKGEISVEKALECCDRFFKLIGHPKPNEIPRVNRSVFDEKKRSPVYAIVFGADCRMSVDVISGKITNFTNKRREFEMEKGLRSKFPSKYPTLIDTQIRFHALAKKLGIPETHKLVENVITGGDDPRTTESPSRRCAIGTFEDYPNGFAIEQQWNSYGIQFDITDGTIVYFSYVRDPGSIIETKAPKLTFKQAKEKAESIAKKFAAGIYESYEPEYRLGKRPAPSTKPSRLEYVCPNGKMGGVSYDLKAKPQHLRLAWVLRYPRGDAIWIDAVDGKLLGGYSHRDRQ